MPRKAKIKSVAPPRKRLRWLDGLRNKLLSVCINSGKRIGGYRVTRIVRAQWDDDTGQIATAVVRLFGGNPKRRRGFNGKIIKLTDRNQFVGGNSLGIVSGKKILPIDVYAQRIYHRGRSEKEQMKKSKKKDTTQRQPHTPPPSMSASQTTAPPLRPRPVIDAPQAEFQEDPVRSQVLELSDCFQGDIPELSATLNPKIDPALLKRLQKLLKSKPSLLKSDSSLPRDSSWILECPNKVGIRFSGFGHRKGTNICVATTIALTEYREGNGVIMAVDADQVSATKVNTAIRALLALKDSTPGAGDDNRPATKPTKKKTKSVKPVKTPAKKAVKKAIKKKTKAAKKTKADKYFT